MRSRRPTSPCWACPSTAGSATGQAPASGPPTSGNHPACPPLQPALQVPPFAGQQVADAGDLAVNPFSIDDPISTIEQGARSLLERTRFVLTLGGDHTVALPMLRAVSAVHGPVAVVHFDAHLDTWDTYFGAPYTHGTPFRRGRGRPAGPDRVPACRDPRPPVYRQRPHPGHRAGLPGHSGARCRTARRDRHGRTHTAASRRPAGLCLDRHRRARPGARARTGTRKRAACPAGNCSPRCDHSPG